MCLVSHDTAAPPLPALVGVPGGEAQGGVGRRGALAGYRGGTGHGLGTREEDAFDSNSTKWVLRLFSVNCREVRFFRYSVYSF